ncbi:MAG: hypothetical protein Q7R31_01165 [Candidatus Levybacteria bacterium]|nr:hypothetical protein [Candidatus Levybacteria bacterium]
MNDGVVSPEIGIENVGKIPQADSAKTEIETEGGKGIILFRTNDIELFVPRKPNVPLTEGISIRVEGVKNVTNKTKETLREFVYALGAGKVIAESRQTPDEPWANTRIGNSSTGDLDVVDIYGINARNPDSWRKPVDANSRNVPEINSLDSHYDETRLVKLFGRYMPKWKKLANIMKLFQNGINEIQGQLSEASTTVWESDRFRVSVNTDPHLNGIHILVDPKEKISRQWQTVHEKQADMENEVMVQRYVQQVTEAAAISLGVRQIIFGGKGEIHNSGNWAGGLKDVSEGGTLSTEKLAQNPKMEKKLHRPDLAAKDKDFGTAVHFHIYVPEDPNAPVVLPVMSEGEAQERLKIAREQRIEGSAYKAIIDQWNTIPKTDSATVLDIRNKLGNKVLTQWLEENSKGQLVS